MIVAEDQDRESDVDLLSGEGLDPRHIQRIVAGIKTDEAETDPKIENEIAVEKEASKVHEVGSEEGAVTVNVGKSEIAVNAKAKIGTENAFDEETGNEVGNRTGRKSIEVNGTKNDVAPVLVPSLRM